jgi:hypothetical protein
MLKPIGQAKACRIRRIEHLIDQEAKTWDEATLRRYFHNCDVEEILKIKLPTTAMEDWVAWRYEKSFVFTIRSAYRHAMRDIHDMGAIGSSSSREGERTIRNKLWSVLIPSKVKVLAWKIVKNGILIRANQNYRHMDQGSMCELCSHGVEDCFHAVITCPHARALRFELRKKMALPDEENI